jgi:hypothetical protein
MFFSVFALCPPKTAKIRQLKLKTSLQFTSQIMIPIFQSATHVNIQRRQSYDIFIEKEGERKKVCVE